jgi:3-oxoacyl-[acyl-carrier-protein] synthase-3
MRGNETFKVAVRSLTELSRKVLQKADIGIDEIDLFIPHQANQRIIQAVGQRLGLDESQVFSNVHRVGNTSAASIPLAMVDARDQGKLKPGDLVLTSSFGGGLTWASALFRF